MIPKVGLRVVRGPDWNWGDQDGGEGHVGTVIATKEGTVVVDETLEIEDSQTVVVAWDVCTAGNYRVGHDGNFDLCVLDVTSGASHQSAKCDACRETPRGIRWYCLECKNYDLCNKCYMNDQHDLNHVFGRFVNPVGTYVTVPTRASSASSKMEAKGMFVGARVHKEQKKGTVTEVCAWKDHAGGAVRVQWDGEDDTQVYRRGAEGELDVKCEKTSSGGMYYKDHLPKLGERRYMMPGNRAIVMKTEEEVKALQENHGGWAPQMTQVLGRIGLVCGINYRGDVKINYPRLGQEWTFNPQALTKLETYSVGDTVCLSEDIETVKRLQPGHGDWLDDMANDLGQEGTVIRIFTDGDVKVLVNGHPWTLHPACLTLVKSVGGQSDDTEEAHASIIMRAIEDQLLAGLFGPSGSASTIVHSMKPEIVKFVINAQKGNLAAIKETLEENPGWVNIRVSKRTALHMACHEGHLEIVKYLISKDAIVSVKDDDGDRPVHYAILGKKPDVLECLLEHGVYVSATNNAGCSGLHLAVHKESPECVDVLLKHGVNVNIQDRSGDVALHDAIGISNSDIIRRLLGVPAADFGLRNHRGFNQFHFAVLKSCELAVNTILEKAPHLASVKKEDGFTPLHIAAFNNHTSIVKILLEKGKCLIDVPNHHKQTPLFLAVTKGSTDTVELLVSRGADMNIPDKDGDTSMHMILERFRTQSDVDDSVAMRKIRTSLREEGMPSNCGALACFLVQNGGDMSITNKGGKTPWEAVTDTHLKKCLQLFIRQGRETFPGKRDDFTQAGMSTRPDASDVQSDVIAARESVELRSVLEEDAMEVTFAEDFIPKLQTSKSKDMSIWQCTVCQEQLTELIGNPCHHAQSWLNDASAPSPVGQTREQEESALRKENRELRSVLSCNVCLERRKAIVFECGHSTCKPCADLLPECPTCRKPAAKVFPLFL